MSKQKNSDCDGGSSHLPENCRNAATFAGERMPVWIFALRIIRNVSATKNSGNATHLPWLDLRKFLRLLHPLKVSVNSPQNTPCLLMLQHVIPQPMILPCTSFSQSRMIAEGKMTISIQTNCDAQRIPG